MTEALTFQQARAHIAETLIRHYTQTDVYVRLRILGYKRQIRPDTNMRSLAYRLAWLLLPADVDCSAADSDLSAVLSVARQRL